MKSDLASLQRTVRWIGLFTGPILAAAVFFITPESGEAELQSAGRATLAMMVWMAVWWLTETVDISATSLLPIALFPLLGIASIKESTAPYASPVIYLFLGGFLIAASMQRWGLDKRIALSILRVVGKSPTRMIGGFMLATAALSAFVSNTATTAMMLPIALSVIGLFELRNPIGQPNDPTDPTDIVAEANEDYARTSQSANFAVCLMLGIAYAASIGGIATIIGTPPNGILVEFLRENLGIDISFAQWLRIGIPITVVFLPIAWILLTRILFPVHKMNFSTASDFLDREYKKLGPTKPGEWTTLIVFLCAALLWIFRPNLAAISFGPEENPYQPFAGLSDGNIAILASITLFVIPVDIKKRTMTMNWETARRIPWGILVLFGGGLSLAAAVKANGVAQFFGMQAQIIEGAPAIIVLFCVVTVVVFLTELTSNTATTAALLPILAAIAPGLDISPTMLCVAAAVSASCAFMMPVATPPNAIVFGSGRVSIPQMAKAGLWLNIVTMLFITSFAYFVLQYALSLPAITPP